MLLFNYIFSYKYKFSEFKPELETTIYGKSIVNFHIIFSINKVDIHIIYSVYLYEGKNDFLSYLFNFFIYLFRYYYYFVYYEI